VTLFSSSEKLWDVRKCLRITNGEITSGCFTCDDSRVIIASSHHVTVFETYRGTRLTCVEVGENNWALQPNPRHPWICAVLGTDGKVYLVDVYSGNVLHEFEHICNLPVSASKWSNDGHVLTVGWESGLLGAHLVESLSGISTHNCFSVSDLASNIECRLADYFRGKPLDIRGTTWTFPFPTK
jgi:WD40 repeat protein